MVGAVSSKNLVSHGQRRLEAQIQGVVLCDRMPNWQVVQVGHGGKASLLVVAMTVL